MTYYDAYRMGREAYARGSLRSDNPFPKNSEFNAPWERGWIDAQNHAWITKGTGR